MLSLTPLLSLRIWLPRHPVSNCKSLFSLNPLSPLCVYNFTRSPVPSYYPLPPASPSDIPPCLSLPFFLHLLAIPYSLSFIYILSMFVLQSLPLIYLPRRSSMFLPLVLFYFPCSSLLPPLPIPLVCCLFFCTWVFSTNTLT